MANLLLRVHLGAIAVVIFMTGCSTPYMIDRTRDAADILTAAVGLGAGAKARVGPLRAGVYGIFDRAGLRGGEVQCYDSESEVGEASYIIASFEEFLPAKCPIAEQRGKHFQAVGVLVFSASVSAIPTSSSAIRRSVVRKPWRQHLPFYTQIETAFGYGGTVRLGLNPGELIDFVLGWATVDIFDDDIAGRAGPDDDEEAGGAQE